MCIPLYALYDFIEQWPDALPIILEVFQTAPKTRDRQWTRMMAVEALADFQNNKVSLEALFDAVEDEDDFIGFLAIQSLKKIFALDDQVAPLLNRLEKDVQIKPNRWIPNFLEERQKLFTYVYKELVGSRDVKSCKLQKKMASESIKLRYGVQDIPVPCK